jgi:cytidylate kinase
MTAAQDEPQDGLAPDDLENRESPRHGFRGDPVRPEEGGPVPAAVTVAISREAGARGGSIGRRVGRALGWQVYDQEMMEYIAQEGNFCQEVIDRLPDPVKHWAEQRLETLLREQNVSQHPSILNLARVILALGGQGEVVLIGRGAGCLLPAATTLHVRVVAPEADRVRYMSQWLRLTLEEAAERVRLRDHRRAEFLTTHFHHQSGDLYQYDSIMNSSLLGEDLCAGLIVQAAREKQARLRGELQGTD